ncbi:hypothetical protein ARALYDRAFT_323655 [Arabidopsis lyrata subsp. lyrata]|uniref:Receptor-like serine/threonine-protein kinase n=2 Tax=Arabidopsis lyrata subsp. lyrata TaxID=81972 RepID=D7LTL2_ARALL|nr:hypothetical protein ARALYDRAFT_323655 [Arabidopsis lyrata subsp. lyrata]
MRTSNYGYNTFLIFLVFLEVSSSSSTYSSVSTSEKRTVSFNETIVSPGNVYELGLLPTDLNWYLGIWHKEDIFKQFIWVANRDKPFSISTGTLKFSENNLVLSDKDNSHVWSANMNRGGVRSPMVAELLDNGNFVVKDSNNDEVLWQTFDYPTDTLLPEMKLGRDKKTGINKVLTSWHPDDPSRIGYSLQVKNQAGLFELSVCGQDTSKCFYRSDPWDGRRFGDIPLDFSLNYVSPNWTRNVEDSNFTFLMTGQNNNSILTMEGRLPQILTWEPERMMWSLSWHPLDFYSKYQICGPNSYSSRTTTFSVCTCIKGFDPAFHENWSLRDWRGGCERTTRLNCTGDHFLQLKNMKLPDTKDVTVDMVIGKKNCEKRCLRDCDCTAYAYVTILKGHAGCVMWTGALNDFQNYSVGGRDLYVKVAAAIDHVIIIIGVVVVALATFATYYYWKQHNRRTIITHGGPSKTMIMNEIARQTRCEFMNLVHVAEATNDFSEANKLGEGGFGVVYKGTLPNGNTVAVKRLAITSSQGFNEFKNEVQTISSVLHINLVRLHGYCWEDREQLLIYEYMENSSLNYYIFDETQSSLLNWEKRFCIIKGIVQGLSYLHNYATPSIIHRDLKPSNILLGKDMIPKISDFGMAKLLENDEIQSTTGKAVGTRGYMSEEYALHGKLSERSDIFSFGVTLLEIVTGKRNIEYCNYYRGDSLLDYVWRHFDEGNILHVVDPNFVDSSLVEEELWRTIQVGLLCVQNDEDDRPSTESVALMLSTSKMEIPLPKKPNYFYARLIRGEIASSSSVTESTSINQITLSAIKSR